MPRYNATVTLYLGELDCPNHGAAEEMVDGFITRLAEASEKAIADVAWGEVDYEIAPAEE